MDHQNSSSGGDGTQQSDANSVEQSTQPYLIPQINVGPVIVQQDQPTRRFNWSLLIETVLCLATIATFLVTYFSVKVTENSLKLAQHQFDSAQTQQLRRDRSEAEELERRLRGDSINRSISERSLQAQIQSLQELQKQFKIQNEPLLQGKVDSVIFEELDNSGYACNVKVHLSNLRQIPLRVTQIVTQFYILPSPPTDSSWKMDLKIKSARNDGLNPHYIDKEEPLLITQHVNPPIAPFAYKALIKGPMFFFVGGRIEYISLLDNSKKVHHFLIRVKCAENGRHARKLLHNSIEDMR